MEKLLLLIVYIITVFEWLSLCYVVLRKPISKPKKNGMVCLFITAVILISTIISNTDYKIYYLFILLFVYTFLSETLFEAVKTWVLSFAIILVLESCVDTVLYSFSLYLSEIREIMAIECACFVIILIWIYYWFIGRKLDKEFFDLPKPIERLFIIAIVVTMLMMSYFSFVLGDVPDIKMVKFGSVIALLGGFVICGMILGIIYYFNNTEKYRMENELSEKYNEQQREYFTKLLEKEQNTRSFRHDIINHLMVMQGIAEREESVKLYKYVGDLLDDINSEQHRQYDVGNDVVNTILNYYLLPIKEDCVVIINGYMSEQTKVSQKDLCTLFSNIVKNAVEAVENLEQKKEITITVNQGEKFLNIFISNSIQGEIAWDGNRLPKTTKADRNNHGLGLKNVKSVVSKYDGRYVSRVEKGYFITEIYIKI